MTETNTTVTAPISQADLEAIERLYSFRDYDYEEDPNDFMGTIWGRERVLNFIKEHSFLMPLLTEIPDRVKHYFPDPKLYLEIHYDPEIIGDVRLNVLIASELKIKEARKKERHFDQDWWWDNRERAQNKLEVFKDLT